MKAFANIDHRFCSQVNEMTLFVFYLYLTVLFIPFSSYFATVSINILYQTNMEPKVEFHSTGPG